MAYETGVPTGFEDLHSKLNTFLTGGGNGWTLDGDVLYKNNTYIRLDSLDDNYLRIWGGTAQAAGVLTNESSHYGSMRDSVIKSSGSSSMSSLGSMNQYYFFTHENPDFVTVVLQYDLIWIQWITFGELDKYGTYGGGTYFGGTYDASIDTSSTYYEFGSHWANTNDHNGNYRGTGIGYWFSGYSNVTTSGGNMGVRCDLDSQTWIGNKDFMGGYPSKGGTKVDYHFSGAALTAYLTTRNPNTWNDQTILAPILVTMGRTQDKISILGNPVHARLTNVLNHNIGDIITLGTDQWMIFPHLKKGTNDLDGATSVTTGNSGRLGFAIKYSA